MSSIVDEFTESLLNAATALLAGDATNAEHFDRTRAELDAALGPDKLAALSASIAAGSLFQTVALLGTAMVAMNEKAEVALEFAAKVAPQHRLPEHMGK